MQEGASSALYCCDFFGGEVVELVDYFFNDHTV